MTKPFIQYIFTLLLLLTPNAYGEEKSPPNSQESNQSPSQSENLITMTTKYGDVVIQLCPEQAPNHVKRIKELTEAKFYDGLSFHRVIPGFMAQTGDPRGDGTGTSDKPSLNAEFNDIKHVRGVVSMARSANPNSGNSQFFIMLGSAPHLDGSYTAFGKVISGMRFMNKINAGSLDNNGIVTNPDKIITMKIGANIEPKKDACNVNAE